MCAWSVSRSISALHSRGLGMTCDHSEKGRFVVTITAAFSAAASVHLIAQVKANQPALHHAIVALCDTAAPVDSTQTADKKRRCRDETRTVEVFAPGGSLADTEWVGHIRAIIRVNHDGLTRSATTGLWRDTLVCQRRRAASRSMCHSHPWPLHIEIARTTSVTVASPRTPAASAAILASLRVCARSLPTSCASTAFITSQMVGIASPSAASVQSSPCASCIER